MKQEKILFNYFTDDLDVIETKIRGMLKKAVMLLTETKVGQIQELWDENRFVRNVGQAYLQEAEVDEKQKRYIVSIGYTNALLDLMQLYLDKVSDAREIEKIKTTYRDAVFEVLAKRKMLMHKDLARELDVSPSGLNDIIKHMNATKVQAINVEQISKYKFYSLTSVAYQYYIRNREVPVSPKPPKKSLNRSYYIANVRGIDAIIDRRGLELPNGDEGDNREGEGAILEFTCKKENKNLLYYFPYTYELERTK